MKKYIREMLDDLRSAQSQDHFPRMPRAAKKAKTVNYNPSRPPVMPYDLDNQELSKDPEEMVRQLDWQAQQKVQNPGH